jgi:hypothetical protein
MADQVRPPDLRAFLRALEVSGGREDGSPGVDIDDIALVESAWQIPDTVVSSYGWVLALGDGRRVYLEYTLDDSGPDAVNEELEMRELQPDETDPVFHDDAGVFWYRPDHINAHLGVAPPSLH